ncbi:hypothetical protein HAX54_028133 [Datura stramonium]|uniref:Uncharacterized protein n=1 Tax=Datura stramonium TaxID=4076 RepID=A0ABS8S9D1_DATST|nr:hypothetical protein [Datura stramonium]
MEIYQRKRDEGKNLAMSFGEHSKTDLTRKLIPHCDVTDLEPAQSKEQGGMELVEEDAIPLGYQLPEMALKLDTLVGDIEDAVSSTVKRTLRREPSTKSSEELQRQRKSQLVGQNREIALHQPLGPLKSLSILYQLHLSATSPSGLINQSTYLPLYTSDQIMLIQWMSYCSHWWMRQCCQVTVAEKNGSQLWCQEVEGLTALTDDDALMKVAKSVNAARYFESILKEWC